MKLFHYLLFLVFIPATLLGQAEPEAKPAEVKPTPYEVANISSALETTNEEIRKATKLLDDTAQFKQIGDDFSLLISEYPSSDSTIINNEIEDLSLWELKDINLKWKDAKAELDIFSEKLKVLLAEVAEHLEITDELAKKWQLTNQVADTADISDALKDPIKVALEKTNGIRQRLRARQELLLLKENEVSSELIYIYDVIDDIEAIRSEKSANILLPDAPPLLRQIKYSDGINIFTSLKKSIVDSVLALEAFVVENVLNIFYHLLLFLALLLFMYYLRKQFKKSHFFKKEEYPITTKILGSPFTGAFLLAIVSSAFFYDTFPPILRDVLILLALVPFLILLPIVLNERSRLFFYFLSILVILDKLQSQLYEDQVSQRIVLLLTSCLGLIGFVAFSLPKSSFYKIIVKGNRRWALTLMRVFALLLAFSIYGNFNGNFQLSQLLTTGVIHMLTVGLAMFIGVNVVRAVLLYLIRSGLNGKLNVVTKFNEQIERWAFILVSFFGIFFWVKSSLRGFALLTPVTDFLTELRNYSWQFGEISLSLSNIIDFVTILAIFIIIANVFQVILKEEILTRFDLRKGIPLAMAVLSRYVIVFLGFLLAMSSAGISLSKLNLLVGALGVGIGFGLQNIVSNFVSGLVIIFERPLHIGDILTAGTVDGEVIEIGLRATRIRTWEGAEVSVPNNNLISSEVTNWTFSDKKRRIERIILIENGPSPREVKNVIDEVVQAQEGLLADPEPMAYFLGFENNALKFRLLIWMTEGLLTTPSEVLMNLYDALDEKGYKAYMPVQKVIVQKPEDQVIPKPKKSTAKPKKVNLKDENEDLG